MINSTQHISGELLALGRFDKEIETYLDGKKFLAHSTITEADVPLLVEALRIWLIKNVGCFNIYGEHHKVVQLSLWYDHDALTEEFDELLLKFRDWLGLTFGIETNKPHNLLRYVRSDTFFIFEGEIPADLIPPPLPLIEEEIDHEVNEVVGFIEEFEQLLEDKVGHNLQVHQFMEYIIPTTQREDIVKMFLV